MTVWIYAPNQKDNKIKNGRTIVSKCLGSYLDGFFLPRSGVNDFYFEQQIVLEKHNTRYVRSATIIDAVYWLILYFFKELNDIPMSTTWVFVGLLCGRELAMATVTGKEKFKSVFPLIGKDFLKMMVGLAASLAIVLSIHYVIAPAEQKVEEPIPIENSE